MNKYRRTSYTYLRFPTRSSSRHSVSMQNSGATKQISPVRLHTTVGVPLYDISFSSSYKGKSKSTSCEQSNVRTKSDLWKHFSTNTSSSSVMGICRAISDGRKIASARTIRKISFFSKLFTIQSPKGNPTQDNIRI
jgi:hypothetical protein